jgi:hypothetical protein
MLAPLPLFSLVTCPQRSHGLRITSGRRVHQGRECPGAGRPWRNDLWDALGVQRMHIGLEAGWEWRFDTRTNVQMHHSLSIEGRTAHPPSESSPPTLVRYAPGTTYWSSFQFSEARASTRREPRSHSTSDFYRAATWLYARTCLIGHVQMHVRGTALSVRASARRPSTPEEGHQCARAMCRTCASSLIASPTSRIDADLMRPAPCALLRGS